MIVQHLAVKFSSTSQAVLNSRKSLPYKKRVEYNWDLRALKMTNAITPAMETTRLRKTDHQPGSDINQGADGETNGDIAQPHL